MNESKDDEPSGTLSPSKIPESDLGTYTRVHLRVKCNTRYGEQVHCSGSSFIMGQYNPNESMVLVTSPEEYPIWYTFRPLILPRGVPHRYMYALFSGGEFSSWEKLQYDRMVIPEGREMFIEEEYGVYDETMILEKKDDVYKRVPDTDGHSSEDREIKRSSSQNFPLKKNHLSGYKRFQSSSYRPLPHSKLFILCYHLPVQLTKLADGTWTAKWNQDSLIAKSEGSVAEMLKVYWIGCITHESYSNFDSLTKDDEIAITKTLETLDCIPLFIDTEIMKNHYQGYCKNHLWPMFHNVDVLDIHSAVWEQQKQVQHWEAYGSGTWLDAYTIVNTKFAEKVVELATELDTVWVHDYHLLLFGAEVERLSGIQNTQRPKMVFFLHIPFPTSEIFRELSNGTHLLEGMLSVDVVGFHSFDHARHFLNACKRFLGLSYQSRRGGNLGLDFKGRNVIVTITHVGLETSCISEALTDPVIEEEAAKLRNKYAGKIIICGVDTCQRLSGVPLKLLAFEQLAGTFSVWKDKVVLIQRCSRTGSRFADQEHSSAEIRRLVDRITEKYGPIIDYEEGPSLNLKQRAALWEASDILLHTAVRGGLNLTPLEYVYCRSKKPGAVLLSEFSACCCILNGAIRINPWDLREITNCLDQALLMSAEERTIRRSRDIEYITKKSSSCWTRQVLSVLQEATENTDDDEEFTDMEHTDQETGMSHVVRIGAHTDFKQLNPNVILQAYQSTNRRLFLLDYGGTIIARENMSMYVKKDFTGVTGRAPSTRMMTALAKLSANPKNTVYIISGVSQVNLTSVLGHIKGLSLAAQNGAFWSDITKQGSAHGEMLGGPELSTFGPAVESLDSEKDGDRMWQHHYFSFDWDKVRKVADPILTMYQSRTNGSILQYMDQGIAWNYRSTDPEWGLMQANQLQNDLQDVLKDFPVTIIRKKGLLEIVPEGLHKGAVARKILSNDACSNVGHADFIFCIGDDTTDESMFKAIYSYIAERTEESVHGPTHVPTDTFPTQNLQHVFTCTVGKKPSNAHLYVNEVEDVENLLSTLGEA